MSAIVLIPHTSLSSPYVVGSHHIYRELRKLGESEVKVINPFLGYRESVIASAEVCNPRSFVPLRAKSPFFRELTLIVNSCINWRGIKKKINLFSKGGVAIVDNPYALGLVRRLKANGYKICFRLTDWMPGQLESPDRETNFRMLVKCAREADLLIATSDPLAAALRRLTGKRVHTITNGVDQFFIETKLDSQVRTDRAIYYGAVDCRFSIELIVSAARAFGKENLEVYGGGDSSAIELLKKNGVFVGGMVEYSKLPNLLSRFRYGVLPFGNIPSNHCRFPMKLLEMVACGVEPISTPIASLSKLRYNRFVHLSQDFSDASFEQTCRATLSRNRDSQAEDVRLGVMRSFSESHTWLVKTQEILQICRAS